MIQRSSQDTDFPSSTGTKTATLATRRPTHDIATIIVSNPQPSPEILNAVGHAILRSIATGQGEMLRSAADALGRLERLLPTASAEARLTAVLIMMASDHPSQPTVASPAPTPTPARRQAKPGKSVKKTRKPKTSAPLIDINGRLLSSKEIGGVAVISQAEARKVLGMNCPQMIKLENQKLLARVQEAGSRLVFYSVAEVQRLLDLVTGAHEPEPSQDGEAMS